MSNREFYVQCRQTERPVFLKVLKALPADKLNYKPHDRSPSAEQLVWTLTNELKSAIDAVVEKRAEWKSIPAPPLDEMIALFEKYSNELTERVSAIDDSAWDSNASFFYNGQKVSEQPISQFLWMIHFDAIHHRGQLSAYIRPMGGKVPAIYGPSADERPSA
ncbi:MAG TPA: DinB family protein [Terriglobales bacterium]|nr:DinB family protein [Terriglobales bacterium]